MKFRHTDLPHFVKPFISYNRCLGRHCLSTVSKASMDIPVDVFHFSCVCTQGRNHQVLTGTVLSSLRTGQPFLEALCHAAFSSAMHRSSSFSTSSPKLVVGWLCCYIYPVGEKWYATGFPFAFPLWLVMVSFQPVYICILWSNVYSWPFFFLF
jgi:hypothetical protein